MEMVWSLKWPLTTGESPVGIPQLHPGTGEASGSVRCLCRTEFLQQEQTRLLLSSHSIGVPFVDWIFMRFLELNLNICEVAAVEERERY